jgi:hypothetical protein
LAIDSFVQLTFYYEKSDWFHLQDEDVKTYRRRKSSPVSGLWGQRQRK